MSVTAPVADERRMQPHLDAVLRRRIARLGMWVFIGSEMLFFGGLFAAYAVSRWHWPQGFTQAGRHTDVVLGTVNTAVLLTSSLLVALAVQAAAHARRRWVPWLLWGAVALGFAFLVVKGFEYAQDFREHLLPGSGFQLGQDAAGPAPAGAEIFFMWYFTATGLHAVHVSIGMVLLGVAGWYARDPRSGWLRSSRMEALGLYWHFVDVVWIFLYPLLYLVGRGP